MEDEDLYDLFDDNETKVCSLSSSNERMDLDFLMQVSKNSQYFCSECKRAANDKAVLCSPRSL